MDANSFYFEGTRCMEAGDISRAESCLRQAILIAPDFAEAHANLGLLLDRQGRTKDAEICYRESIELNPLLSESNLNLGALLAKNKRFNEAETAYQQAISLKPHAPVAWSNMGVLLTCLKREEEAEKCYRTAIFLDEYYAAARFNLSYLLLRQGRFEEGWYCLESRSYEDALVAKFTCPRWQGEALFNKSIAISYVAGHGDAIQFCRYAAVLKTVGAQSITLVCHPALITLFAELKDVDAVISFDEELPESNFHFWTSLLSLPYYCKTRIDSIPANIPYLHAPCALVEKWAHKLPDKSFCVGLVWKGSALFENDADRSLPSLEVLAPLWKIPGITWVSLQKGSSESEPASPPGELKLLDLGPELHNFADTAAVITHLDLVICVDTAVAHLAGALGKPCWVMLPEYKTDWRWLTTRSDSPWYPVVMRLFRQTTNGDWTTVVGQIVKALGQLTQKDRL